MNGSNHVGGLERNGERNGVWDSHWIRGIKVHVGCASEPAFSHTFLCPLCTLIGSPGRRWVLWRCQTILQMK